DSMRVQDAGVFLKEVVGTNWEFTTDDISSQCRSFLVTGFSDALGQAKIPVLDLVGRYQEMGQALNASINAKFAEHGLELLNLMIENVSVPPEVEAAIDKRSSMGALGNLDNYMKYQAAESMTENPGGVGAMGAQMAAGMAMGQQIMQNMNQPAQQPAAAPPPVPTVAVHVVLDGAAGGPHGVDALRGLISQGRLTRETLVWKAGLAEWVKAADLPEVASLFGQAPPPVPPPPAG
ncbi:MAG: SPFH domain-containing protein, partial [Fimbriimonadaceae bacterium]|nr:SPFH domain-containing protein [Fimbriimonadaceae bacterium]